MIVKLLVKGMIAGLLAGVLAFGVARIWGEPSIDAAIALEEVKAALEVAPAPSHDHSVADPAPAGHSHGGEEEELVSRATQAGMGLATGVIVFCAALGGVFALVFAVVNDRISHAGPRATAAVMAVAGFVTISLVPALKYAPNPPAVGDGETIGLRTALFFGMIALSILAAIIATGVTRALHGMSRWHAGVAGIATYVVLTGIVCAVLPTINEVGTDFPASILWEFRVTSLQIHALIWAVLGLLFGELAAHGTERRATQPSYS